MSDSEVNTKEALLVFCALLLAAVLQCCEEHSAYYDEREAFAIPLTYEEAMHLELSQSQISQAQKVNYEFYDRAYNYCTDDPSFNSYKEQVQMLVADRNIKMMSILNDRQKDIWEKQMQETKK